MRTLFAVALLALGAGALAAQDDKKDDKKYESKDGKFAAKFPTAPTKVEKAPGGLALHMFFADFDKDKGRFMVTYCDLAPALLKAATPAQILTSSEKEGLVAIFKAKILKSEATTFGPKKYAAREITADIDERQMRGRIILVDNRLYQVFALGSKEFVASKDADAFLASFELK